MKKLLLLLILLPLLSFSQIDADKMVTFSDMKWLIDNDYFIEKNSFNYTSIECATKLEVIDAIQINISYLTAYTDDQLIPYKDLSAIFQCNWVIDKENASSTETVDIDLSGSGDQIYIIMNTYVVFDKLKVYSGGSLIMETEYIGEHTVTSQGSTYYLYNEMLNAGINSSDIDYATGRRHKYLINTSNIVDNKIIVEVISPLTNYDNKWTMQVSCIYDTSLNNVTPPTNISYSNVSYDNTDISISGASSPDGIKGYNIYDKTQLGSLEDIEMGIIKYIETSSTDIRGISWKDTYSTAASAIDNNNSVSSISPIFDQAKQIAPIDNYERQWLELPGNNTYLDYNICNGDFITLWTEAGDSFLWSTGATSDSITTQPSRTTTYWCDITTAGVTIRYTITVTVYSC